MRKLVMVVAMVMASSGLLATSLTDGLVGYWPFDGDAKDYSGNGNHGTTHGVTLTADRYGNSSRAYRFGGYFNGGFKNAGYIAVPDSSSINNVLTPVTIAGWIRIDSWCMNNGNGVDPWASIMCKGNETRQFGIQIEGSSKYGWGTADYRGPIAVKSIPSLHSWVHIALTDNGNMQVAYINGAVVGSKTSNGTPPRNSGSLYFGKDPVGDLEYFNGLMDDLSLYNRALSSSEISALYNGGLRVCKVSFNANGDAVGGMNKVEVLSGKVITLPANQFCRDGYLFQGWAVTTNGEVVYKDEAEIEVDSDMTLFAVWANPALNLTAESADWSSGSITLCCTDADTSGEKHKYTLQCFHDDVSEWVDVGDDRAIDVSLSADGKAHLTDGFFAERFDGIPPVKYRVRDKHNRASAECVTRTKYGIFVSPGGYAPEMNLAAYPSASPNYAATFGDLANGKGRFSKVHVLTGSNAIYNKINDAVNDVAGKIKTGDVCFLYFGTHGGLHPNSTSSRLVLYSGYYEEEQLANHIKFLNGVDASHPNGNGVAIVGFVHACHAKGISDNSLDDETFGGYCQSGSWCVNSALVTKNTAWVTATDDPKALSIGDYFSLFLLDYGWGNGWALDSGDKSLSCDKLAEYTKERTDAIFKGLVMKYGGDSYKVEVGVVDSSSILRNIYIGNCGSHSAKIAPANPHIAAQGSIGSIALEFSNISDADRTILFTRRGEDATWDSGFWNNLSDTFSYNDPDVESSGRECPYFYQLRTMNGAGVGVSNMESAWRIHTENHRVSFYYDVPQGVSVSFGGHSWELPYDSTLNDIWGNLDEQIKGLGISGYIHTGWYTERNGKGRRISSDERVLVDVDYYADWTAMTQEWLNRHTQVAAASGGDIATAAVLPAANGCRTVAECYALGIDPEDPNDDLKITDFKIEDGKPVITLNHTEDGSGNSFEDRVKTLGAKSLGGGDESWADMAEVPAAEKGEYRFFKVAVELR